MVKKLDSKRLTQNQRLQKELRGHKHLMPIQKVRGKPAMLVWDKRLKKTFVVRFTGSVMSPDYYFKKFW